MNQDPPRDPDSLPRVLGPFDAYALVVGCIIGSGIFLKPSGIARDVGSFPWIIAVWLFVGLVALCGALAIAELAAMLPRAGGPYVYLREAYGRLSAFLWGWAEFWINRSASLGALAAACVLYFNRAFPFSERWHEAATMSLVIGLTLINILGVRWGATVQNFTVICKLGVLLAIAAMPLLSGKGEVANLSSVTPAAAVGSWDFIKALGAAMIAVWWAYDGWINVGPVAEEVKNPQRIVPLALVTGLLSVIGVYCLANVGYHAAFSMSQVAGSEAIASDTLQLWFGGIGATVAALAVAISTLGAANGNLIVGPRVIFSVARDGLLPARMKRVHHRFQTPANAILLQCLWGLILVRIAFYLAASSGKSIGDAFDWLTDFAIFGSSIFYSMAVAAVFVLRRKMPDAERPYRVWGYPYTTIFYLVGFAAFVVSMFIKRPGQSLAGCGLIALGAVYYWFALRLARAPGGDKQSA
ncbi:MAG TPA: amino acid permease [Planctomycetia bacterium]|nr:amino acid permease [Planctomycetia bacterium]